MGIIGRRLVFLSLMLGMILFAGCGSSNLDEASGEMQVVRVVCEKQSGSGVVYEASEDQVIIVTAAHVVEDADAAEVVLSDSPTTVSEIVRVAGLDLAFLRVEGVKVNRTARENLRKSKESDSLDLFIQGYDQSGEWMEVAGTISEEWIYIEDFQSHMMTGNAKAVSGMSGGGVFDIGGKFVGIICGMDSENNVAILPASVIESEYGVYFQN